MKDQKLDRILTAIKIFLSFFGIGFIPLAPGTWGSLATLPFLYCLGLYHIPVLFLIPLTVILIVISCFLAEVVQLKLELHDPQWIVIDEVLGMTITWFFWPDYHFSSLFLAFLLFRFFDIVKIWPASYFDKKVKHGAGTILDDVVSGLYAGSLLLILQKFIFHF